MVDITDRLVSLLGLETLKEKLEKERNAAWVENELSKSEAITEALVKLEVD